MNRRSYPLVAALCLAALFSAGLTVSKAQTPASGTVFTGGKAPRQVTIRTRQGQALTVLNIPVGVVLSIQGRLASGTLTPDSPVVFDGDVSIRTKSQSQMVAGSTQEQMLTSPLRLDVQDAVVELRQLR
jgi:hypothetical protein